MSSTKRKEYLPEVGIMRLLLILSIVIGHSFAIYGSENYRAWPLPENYEDIASFHWINPFFISFSLQAFVFLSGYVFEHQVQGNLQFKRIQITKKVKRLIIPTIVFGTIYLLSLDFAPSLKILSTNFLISLLSGPGHLWFLPMLFWCFFIVIILYEIISQHLYSAILWLVLAVISIGSLFIPDLFRASRTLFYLFFFILGIAIYRKRMQLFKLPKLVFYELLAATLLLCFVRYKLLNVEIDYKRIIIEATDLLIGIIGSFMSLIMCHYLSKINRMVVMGAWGGFF